MFLTLNVRVARAHMYKDSTGFVSIAPVFRVIDLARSLAFYRDRLGFTVEFVFEDFYAGVCRDGCHLHLKCSLPGVRDQAAFELEEHIDASINVRSARALSAAFSSSGVAFLVPIRSMPYGTEFYVRDPDGYVLGFVEPPPAEAESDPRSS